MPERLKAICQMPYGNHVYGPGDEFMASAADANTLVMLGRATRVADEPVSGEYLTADVKAEEPAKRKPGRPRKGAYLRRDMRADE